MGFLSKMLARASLKLLKYLSFFGLVLCYLALLNRKVNSGINKQEKVIETLSEAKEEHNNEHESNKLLNKIVVNEDPKIDEFKGVESNIKAFDKKVDPLGDLMEKR